MISTTENLQSVFDPMADLMELTYSALAQTGCGVLIADVEGRVVFVNDSFCQICGYSRGELIGRNPKMLQSGRTNRETYLMLWNTVSSGRSWHGELDNRKKSGEFYRESITISPIKAASGEITHFCAIMHDITREVRERAELQRLDREDAQAAAQKESERFNWRMAHELKNALCGIFAALSFAKTQVKDPSKVEQLLEKANRSADSACGIVDRWTAGDEEQDWRFR